MLMKTGKCKCVLTNDIIRKTESESAFKTIQKKSTLTQEDDLKVSNLEKDENLLQNLKASERLFYHKTITGRIRAEARRNHSIQGDELDFVLSTSYKHNEELFPDKCDVYLQPVTQEATKRKRKIATLADFKKPGVPFDDSLKIVTKKVDIKEFIPKRFYKGHPLILGGLKKRVHPCSVKLMNSSHHSPQTNAGYMRQDMDGNLFQY